MFRLEHIDTIKHFLSSLKIEQNKTKKIFFFFQSFQLPTSIRKRSYFIFEWSELRTSRVLFSKVARFLSLVFPLGRVRHAHWNSPLKGLKWIKFLNFDNW